MDVTSPFTRIELTPFVTEVGPSWTPLVTIPYGDAPAEVGLWGDPDWGTPTDWGPEYGCRLVDGSFAVLDTASRSLKVFEVDGTLRMSIDYPPDGELQLAWAHGPDLVSALVVGQDAVVAFDLATRSSSEETATGQGGRWDQIISDRRAVQIRRTDLVQHGYVVKPPAGDPIALELTGPEVVGRFEAWAELAMDANGWLHAIGQGYTMLEVDGHVEGGEGLGRYVVLDATGAVRLDEATIDLDGRYDTGSHAHLTPDPHTGGVLLWVSAAEGLVIFGRA